MGETSIAGGEGEGGGEGEASRINGIAAMLRREASGKAPQSNSIPRSNVDLEVSLQVLGQELGLEWHTRNSIACFKISIRFVLTA